MYIFSILWRMSSRGGRERRCVDGRSVGGREQWSHLSAIFATGGIALHFLFCYKPCKQVKLFLRISLPLILLASLALLLCYLEARSKNPVAANFDYPELLEYIFAALFLTACGTFLIEATVRDVKRKK